MKKAILALIIFLVVPTGCMTKNQLEGEKAYYQAMVALKTQQANQPIFKMTPAKEGEPIVLGNVASIEVYAPRLDDKPLQQYVHQDFGVKEGFRTVNAIAPYAAVGVVAGIVGEAAKSNNTSYNQSVTGTNNTGRIAGPSTIHSNVAGNNNTVGGAVEQPITTTTTSTTTTTPTTNTNTNTHTGTTTTGDVNN